MTPASTAAAVARPARRRAEAGARSAPAPGTAPRPRPAVRPRPAPRRAPVRRSERPAPAGLLGLARRLIDHPLLDRLIRGRGWIAIIAVTLLAVVAMQLSLLKLGSGIGRALTHTGRLERENATLRLQVSALSDPERIQAQAARHGMVLAPPGALRFVGGSTDLVVRALAGLRAGAGKVTATDTPGAGASTPPAGATGVGAPSLAGTAAAAAGTAAAPSPGPSAAPSVTPAATATQASTVTRPAGATGASSAAAGSASVSSSTGVPAPTGTGG